MAENNLNDNRKKDGSVTVILKVDMHCMCAGCAAEIIKYIRNIEGVKSVKSFEGDNKFAVVGEVDPLKLCEKIQQKQKKKVELVSPMPNKDKNKGKETEKVGGEWEQKKKNIEDKQQKKQDNGKSKEPPITMLKLNPDFDDKSMQTIMKIIMKSQGYQEVSIDQKNFVIKITGTMDVKALVETINKKLKKTVEIVPPKKDGGNEKNESDSGDQMKGGGEGKASDNNVRDGGGMMEGNRSETLPKEIMPPNKASGNEKNQKDSGSGGGGGRGGNGGAEQGKWGGEKKASGDCGRDGGGMMERNNSGYVPYEYQNPYANDSFLDKLRNPLDEENPNACCVL